MIVACPSCHTRYRHGASCVDGHPTAQCSRCDEQFPLTEARRTYVLLPGGAVTPRVNIGMDDPSLASKIAAGAAVETAESALPSSVERVAARTDLEDTPAEDRPTPVMADGPGPFSEFLVAVVPTGACAGIAYYFAAQQQLDPIALTALGGAAGLLLGWGCLLWIRRKN